jgi:hypothetical protein
VIEFGDFHKAYTRKIVLKPDKVRLKKKHKRKRMQKKYIKKYGYELVWDSRYKDKEK